MDGSATINVVINGTVIASYDGGWSLGENTRPLSELITITDNVIEFTDKFRMIYIMPPAGKTAKVAFGNIIASDTKGFLVSERGVAIPILNNRLSIYTGESLTISVMAFFSD